MYIDVPPVFHLGFSYLIRKCTIFGKPNTREKKNEKENGKHERENVVLRMRTTG